jgi:hypothetical protein
MLRLTSLLCVLCACTGTEVGNPVDIDFTLYEEMFDPDAPTEASARGGSGLVTITEAWLAIDRVRLRSAAACDGEAEREFEGPFFADLLTPGPVPALAALDIPDVGYCRFEVKWNAFSSGLPASAPPELASTSLLVKGSRGDGVSFVIRSSRDDELRLDAVDGAFDVVTTALLVGFSGPRLFAGVDLDSAVVAGDGVIYIDGENNELLLDVFDANVKDAADLFDDDDGNGELDADERDDTDILAQ